MLNEQIKIKMGRRPKQVKIRFVYIYMDSSRRKMKEAHFIKVFKPKLNKYLCININLININVSITSAT